MESKIDNTIIPKYLQSVDKVLIYHSLVQNLFKLLKGLVVFF